MVPGRQARLILLAAAALAVAAPAARADVFSVPGFRAPGTPAQYDQVQVSRYGSPSARKVLVLVPGTLAGAADFSLIGPYLAAHVPGLQVWAQERREGALEDNSVLLSLLAGTTTLQSAFDYYLGWLGNPSITPHFQPLDPAKFAFVDGWGLNVAMEDLRAVILLARDGGRRTVILGGHSLGAAEAAIYPAWNFGGGHLGYRDIAGVVAIDGGVLGGARAGTLTTAAQARAQLASLKTKGPWLDLLGLGLPWVTGPFAELAALAAKLDPSGPSLLQAFPLVPAALRPPVAADNLASLGYAFDASTSPASLALIHVHSGHLDTSVSPAGWSDDGPTPIENLADAFSVEPLGPVDWYYPTRLTIDVEAAFTMRATAAARVLGLHNTALRGVNVPFFAFATSLGGAAVLTGARAYEHDSHVPRLELVDQRATYSHLDPLLAAPESNTFLETVVPWLEKIR
jgi:hypothetical protein